MLCMHICRTLRLRRHATEQTGLATSGTTTQKGSGHLALSGTYLQGLHLLLRCFQRSLYLSNAALCSFTCSRCLLQLCCPLEAFLLMFIAQLPVLCRCLLQLDCYGHQFSGKLHCLA